MAPASAISVRYCNCGSLHLKVGPLQLDLGVDSARAIVQVLSKALQQFDSRPKPTFWAPHSHEAH